MPGLFIVLVVLVFFLASMRMIPRTAVAARGWLFSFSARTRMREVSWTLLVSVLAILFAAPLCRAQITNVMDDQSAPIPGAGHDYIHLLTETVNPANGSLSVRIEIPAPKSRGITLPFSITYDSNGVTFPTSTPSGVMEWGTANANYEGVESGGWAYNVPYITARTSSVYDNSGVDQCDYWIDYMFASPSGGRHALRLSAWKPGSPDCTQFGPTQYLSGGDDRYQAAASDGNPLTSVADADGTVYNFSLPGLPYSVVDRNGNQVTFSNPNSYWGFTMTDTAGRAAIVVSSFDNPTSKVDTITASGLSNSYHVSWGSETPGYTPSYSLVYHPSGAGHCASFDVNAITQPVITTIQLPNNQAYQFHYDSTYGLLNEIDYPTGAKVVYTWGLNHLSEPVSLYDRYGNVGACGYQYDTPVVTQRQVYDSSGTLVLTQSFAYETQWNTTNPLAWNSKTATVTQTGAGGTDSKQVYTYGSVEGSVQPNDQASYDNVPEIPVENQVVYKDGTGNTLRTVTKGWYDEFELACQLDTHDGSGLSGVFYTYGAGAQVTDKEEYDYGAISSTSVCPANPTSPITMPSGSTRDTQTTYTSIAGSSGFKIEDRPTCTAVYSGSGPSTLCASASNMASQVSYAYDGNGNAESETRECLNGCSGGAGNATTEYTYDGHGQLTSMTDPRNYTTQYAYDSSYDTYLTQITYPQTGSVNHVVSFGYNLSSGELTSSTDQNGNATTYQYDDSLNRLTEIDYPDGGKTTYSYNDTPPVSVTTEKLLSSGVWANASTSTMDGLGHVIRVIGENLFETDTAYDGEGRLYTQTNPGDSAHSITYNHDALERLSSTVFQDGSTARVSYIGNCATTTDPANKTNETCSDALGRMISDTDGLGNTTTYAYDALDNLRSVTEGVQTRTFNYNSLSELYSETNPESGTTAYTYDGDGNVLSRADARSITTTYSYDADNRLTGKTYSDGETAVSYGYDGVGGAAACPSGDSCYNTGWRTSMTDASGNSLWTYDSMGRVLVKQQTIAGTTGAITYSYDLDGSLARLVDSMTGYRLDYTVNGAEQETALHSETDGANYVSNATYAPQGALATMPQGDGVVLSEGYDSRLRPSTITAALNSTDIFNLAYGYDGDSNVLQVAQTNVSNADFTANYTYDALNRIYSASSTGAAAFTQQFGYDNTTAENDPGGRYGNVSCTSANNAPCAQLTFDLPSNRITLIGNQTPTYDAAGEMLSDGTGTGSTQYTWNAEGRMATVTPNGGAPTTYVYDGDGHRVEDTAAQTLFWYGADGTLLGMTDPAGPGDVEWIYFAGRRISKFVMGYAGPWGAAFYDDANGSLLLETDGYGNTNCRANYYPFGDPVGSGCQPYENIQFAGLYSDATGEDGGDSATHRRYSATYYRWFSPDPAGMAAVNLSDPQTWNMYAYAGNNPTSRNDPSGEDYRVCQEGENGDSTNCTVLTDRQYDTFIEQNKNTLSFAGSKIFANGTQIGTSEYIPTIDPSTAFALHAVGEFSNAEIKSAAITMGINGALAGVGALIGAGIDWLTASEETGTPAEINWGQQEKHFEGHNSYIPGRSTLTANPEELAQEAGTGTPVNDVPRGAPGFKERVDFGKVIGTYNDPITGFSAPTTKGIIVYSKDGVHIYPVRP